ncbi:restriction endonuclease subunit M [bacterium]|nr:restriction endonuclease subunit M [bacterium]
MANLINFKAYPLNVVLTDLLKDRTTQDNIIFATDAYSEFHITEKTPISMELLTGTYPVTIQPRVTKTQQQQSERTHKKAEVFTPSWMCNKMNNYCDADWFGREDVFNVETEKDWEVNTEPIRFASAKGWREYVDSLRLEITCGEAPYLVSRYDTTTGEIIDVERRIGLLDRKLRVIGENAKTEAEWFKWVQRAYQSVYGYEFQGDNLLIARCNLLLTFVEYMQLRWNREPNVKELKAISKIITWNLWQMDGLTGALPYRVVRIDDDQLDLPGLFDDEEDESASESLCVIFDWRKQKVLTYVTIDSTTIH